MGLRMQAQFVNPDWIGLFPIIVFHFELHAAGHSTPFQTVQVGVFANQHFDVVWPRPNGYF